MISRSYYSSRISEFLLEADQQILGALAAHHVFALDIEQRNAWLAQIAHLKEQLSSLADGDVFFEFAIPRMGKRVDVVLLIEGAVFVIEYKVGSAEYQQHAKDQVLDYALDLKNFHEGSHHRWIVPILVATRAPAATNALDWYADRVAKPLCANRTSLSALITMALKALPSRGAEQEDATELWARSGYKPTPTIVEAAKALYEGHSVEDISRSDAGAKNLSVTAECIFDIIGHSRQAGRKSICFVTGVPGAGKTLAGLNISTRRLDPAKDEHAVFLSGNGPLVLVLREALARDEVAARKWRASRSPRRGRIRR